MAGASMLVLGSPIKNHVAPSMLGPTGTAAVTARAPAATSTTGSAGMLASGWGSTSGTHLAARAAVAKTTVVGGILGTLFYAAAIVAVGYVSYYGVKALLNIGMEEPAQT